MSHKSATKRRILSRTPFGQSEWLGKFQGLKKSATEICISYSTHFHLHHSLCPSLYHLLTLSLSFFFCLSVSVSLSLSLFFNHSVFFLSLSTLLPYCSVFVCLIILTNSVEMQLSWSLKLEGSYISSLFNVNLILGLKAIRFK